MCRHLVYLGSPCALRTQLLEPPYSLLRQSWAPRRQRHGTVNADGFGVGWYAHADPVPARYRTECPMWADPSFPDLTRVTTSRAFLAAVRDATPGMPGGVGAVAPFAHDRYLFSHNGALPGWPDSARALAEQVPPGDLLTMEATTDSGLLWVLVRRALSDGGSLADALRDVVKLAAPIGGRLNLLLTDGVALAATTWGDTLSWRADEAGLVVASEPHDDAPDWTDVPDRSLVTGTREGIRVEPLA